MSRLETPARPEWRIRTGARFTPTFSFILSKHFINSFSCGSGFSFRQAHDHLQIQSNLQRKVLYALSKMIYKNQVSGFNPFFYKIPRVQKMICKISEYTLIRRTLSMTLRCVILAFFSLLTRYLRIDKLHAKHFHA